MKANHFIHGIIYIKIQGAQIERFINICHHNNINIINISETKAIIKASDYKKTLEVANIAKITITIEKKCGIPFIIHKYRKHYFYAIGITVFFIINIYLSKMLWKIDIEGNVYYSDKVILNCIKNECGTDYGCKIKDISCYELETILRTKLELLTWVSCDIEGSTLTINLVENSDKVTKEDNVPNDIIADKDGVIEYIITRSGTPIVKKGDEVSAGDVLVMSKISAKNESDDVFDTKYVKADADILINTSISYEKKIERTYYKKEYTGREMLQPGMKIGTRLVNFNLIKCNYELYDIYTKYEKTNIYGNLNLPITYFYSHYLEYCLNETEYEDYELEKELMDELNKYIMDLEENGIQIKDNSVKIDLNEDYGLSKGEIHVIYNAIKFEAPHIEPEESKETTE